MSEQPASNRARAVQAATTLGLIALGLAAWKWVLTPMVGEVWISTPEDVAVAFWRGWADGQLLRDLIDTLRKSVPGFVYGGTAGISLGLVLGRSRWLDEVFSPYVAGAYAVPRVAYLPIFILWLGIGPTSTVALVASIVFFICLTTVREGVRELSTVLERQLRLMGASRLQLIRTYVVPAALQHIVVAVVLAIPYSLFGAILGEMVIGGRGLGATMVNASGRFQSERLFAAALTVALVAGILTAVVSRIFHRRSQPLL